MKIVFSPDKRQIRDSSYFKCHCFLRLNAWFSQNFLTQLILSMASFKNKFIDSLKSLFLKAYLFNSDRFPWFLCKTSVAKAKNRKLFIYHKISYRVYFPKRFLFIFELFSKIFKAIKPLLVAKEKQCVKRRVHFNRKTCGL